LTIHGSKIEGDLVDTPSLRNTPKVAMRKEEIMLDEKGGNHVR
jgi:hypothetical protein